MFKSKKQSYILIMQLILMCLIINLSVIDGYCVTVSTGNFMLPLKTFMNEYRVVFGVFIGFVLLTNIIIFIYHFVRMTAKSSNPQERKKCLEDIFISGICLSLLGGGTIIIYLLFYLGT